MGRPRKFDETEVVSLARELFASKGYHGTSLDELVNSTGLLRGSIYKAFGSKRNLFEAALLSLGDDFDQSPESLDLLTVALKELASEDAKVAKICQEIINRAGSKNISEILGRNLLAKVKGKNQ